MKASEAALQRLDGLIGADTLSPQAPVDEARLALRTVLEARDDGLLAALIVRTADNVALVPRSPAWHYPQALWRRLMISPGELALVDDRLVFFQEVVFGDDWKRVFDLPASDTRTEWGTGLWKYCVTVGAGAERFRLAFYPPKGQNLQSPLKDAETGGALEAVSAIASLLESSPVDKLLDGVGDLARYPRNKRLALLHIAYWHDNLDRAKSGQRPPFETLKAIR